MRPLRVPARSIARVSAVLLLAVLHGSIAFARAASERAGTGSAPSSAQVTPFRVTFWGTPSSSLLLGTRTVYEPSNATFALQEGGDSSVTVILYGATHVWSITMTPPGFRPLTPGVYDSTDYDHRRPSPHARFYLQRDSSPSFASARFEVRRLDRASDGRIRALWMRFRIPDWYGTSAADSGEVWFNADTSLFVRGPGDVVQRTGTDVHFGVRAIESAGRPVQISLLAAPSGTVVGDHGDGTATVDVPAGGLTPGNRMIRLVCASASGSIDTTSVSLRTLNAAFLRDTSSYLDPVTYGLTESRDERDAVFAVAASAAYRANATVWTPDHIWTLVFQGPTTEALAPANYSNARFGFGNTSPDGWAHLTVQLDGRTCPFYYTGSIDLRKIRYAPSGAIRSLWVKFQQSCSGAPPFVGELCWQADTSVFVRAVASVHAEIATALHLDAVGVDTRGMPLDYSASVPPTGATIVDHHDGTASLEWPAGPPAPGAYVVTWIATSSDGHADTVRTAITAVISARIAFDSPAGGGLSATGVHLRYTAADGQVSTAVFSDQSISTSFGGQGHSIFMRFGMPMDLPVREGVFERARFVDRNQRNEPALGLTLDISSCEIDSATFHIRHLERAPDGTVKSLWAVFMQHCVGATGLTTGELRVSADTSLYIEAPGEIDRAPGDSVSFGVRAVDTRGHSVALTALQIPAGASYAPTSPGSGRLEWASTDGIGAVTQIRFAAASDDGKVDTVVTIVRTFGPDRWRMTSAPGDYMGLGRSYDLRNDAGDFFPRISGSAMEVVWRGRRDDWKVQVSVPYGRPPAQGRYDNAVSTRTRALPNAGVDLTTTGRSGAADHGSFDIRKIRVDAAGIVRSLWMVFEVSQTSGPGVVGEICLASPDTTYWIDAPADRYFDPGQAGSFDIDAHGTLAVAPRWTLISAPPGVSLAPAAGPRATILWAGSANPGNYAVRLRVESGGIADSAVTWIHVAGPSYVKVDVAPSFYASDGMHRRFLDRDATFAYWRVASNNAISVTLTSPVANARWDFSRADHQKLTPGAYVITDWPPPYGNSPYGLGFYWGGTENCTRNARFDIWDVTYSADDSLLSFSATLTYVDCSNGPPFSADLHFPGTDVPVGVRASLVDATWTGTAAHMRWVVTGGAGAALRVERSRTGDDWEVLGAPIAEGSDLVSFDDTGVKPGVRYGYRLVDAAGAPALGEIAWIDVPLPIKLDLQRLGPNPGGAPLSFAMSVPHAGPVTLELLDVAGRLRDRRQWTLVPAGRSLVRLEDSAIRPGCYFARLTAGGATVSRSVVIVR